MLVRFFFSDPHFGHANNLAYSERPFASIADHDRALIANYQMTVDKYDTVLWCGDCFFCPMSTAEEILRQLPGRKILVLGNHDRSASRMARLGFDLVADELKLLIAGTPVRVNHFPYRGSKHGPEDTVDDRFADRRPPRISGEVLIHGHTHSKGRRKGSMIHVGVDAWDYRPVAIAEVAALIEEWKRTPSCPVEMREPG